MLLHRKKLGILVLIPILSFFLFLQNVNLAAAAGEVATYTAPDGFKVVSYSKNWSTQQKLKEVYNELLQNTRGEEFKLLTRINIYPGPEYQGSATAGKWFGQWQVKNNVPTLTGNRYINLYNGDKLNGIHDIARTLSHEYGHHFTYYYFFKKEKMNWDSWRNAQFAQVRGIKNHPKVAHESVEHKWLVQEIAAEDYVQLFGSPNAKRSEVFKDISERIAEGTQYYSFSSDVFNLQPQENTEIPLANNMNQLKNYWLSASGIKDKWGKAPTKPILKLEQVNKINPAPNPQYIFNWTRSTDDKTTALEYTLVSLKKTGTNLYSSPIRTVYNGAPLSAVVGAAQTDNIYTWEEVPTGVSYYLVYVKDGDDLITASDLLAVDYSNRLSPDSVLIDDESRTGSNWFKPRVKVNQNQLIFDVQPENVNGRLLVPLRAIFEALGTDVSWDGETKTIKTEKNDHIISMQINNNEANINGEPILLDEAPRIKNGRTLVPLRFVSEALGADVDWNQNLMLATIRGN